MSNYIQRALQASKLKTPYNSIIGLAFLSLGAVCGYLKAKSSAEHDNKNYGQSYLKQYISQEQINYTIDKSGKPAVIYYYQPGIIQHYNVRHGFINGSTIAKQNANFYLVNLTKKLQKTIPQLQHKFPINQFLLQIRFPKQNCQIQYTDGQLQQKIAYRREFFNYNYIKSGGVENFLQQNGIIPAKDPFQNFINLSKQCLFRPIDQESS